MAKGPALTDEVTGLITSVHRKHLKWKAPMVRNEVESLLLERNPNMLRGFPSLSSVQKVLATVRKKELDDLPQDKSWTLDALRDNPVPPQALPKVFEIWLTKQANPLSPPLSIREARWIVQLSSMTEDMELLRLVAEICADRELIGELTNTPQLSMPTMILHIYSHLAKMSLETEHEHFQAISKEKHVPDSRREYTIKGLRAIYDPVFLETMGLKSQSKKGKGGTK